MATTKPKLTKYQMGMKKNEVPAAACQFNTEDVEITPAGEDADTAKFRMVARSSEPITHWYWGKIAHDLSGYQMSRNKCAIDYVHNDDEIIGFANKFEVEEEGLVASGALTPFKEGDRAEEVIFKARAGVPWEASINFSGGPLVLEEVQAGAKSEVNGYEFEGPGVIVRKWPLRGIAVCPYGADPNTSTEFSVDDTVSVTYVENEEMAEEATVEKVDVFAKNQAAADAFVDSGGSTAKPKEEEGAAAPVETLSAADKEAEAGAAAPAVEAPTVPAEKYFERFGEQQGALYFAKGLSFNEALEQHVESQQEEISSLKSKLSDKAKAGEEEPVSDSEGSPKKKESALKLPAFLGE